MMNKLFVPLSITSVICNICFAYMAVSSGLQEVSVDPVISRMPMSVHSSIKRKALSVSCPDQGDALAQEESSSAPEYVELPPPEDKMEVPAELIERAEQHSESAETTLGRLREFMDYAGDYFASLNDEEKMHALQLIPPVGDGFEVFDSALENEQNDEIKQLALQKLIDYGGFSGIAYVIEGLERQDLAFDELALPILANSSDPSVPHLIKSKLSEIPEGPRRDIYLKAMEQLRMRYGS